MGQVVIEGVPVSFPYDLYDCQLEYLKVLIKSLQQGKNALLKVQLELERHSVCCVEYWDGEKHWLLNYSYND